MKRDVLTIEGISVRKEYFAETEDKGTSSVSFSNEEVRRSPGSAGDVSRILMSLPSVAKVNDQSNNLVIRGGSPIENTFYIDNIEIPNINHFPTQGASGGPIGMINVELLQDVSFLHRWIFFSIRRSFYHLSWNYLFGKVIEENLMAKLDLNFCRVRWCF